ncbi:MAG: hypothetical protein O9320_02185 [Magnetospirillum sp.]|nr:hypothetical protein [Magnetospirillum sp.]
MRIRLALVCMMALLLQACLPAGGSVWAVDAGYGTRGPVYGPYPYPSYAVPYGYYPYSRFEPSPFWGTRPVFPYGHPRRCVRDRWGRIWC